MTPHTTGLQPVLARLGVSQADFGRAVGLPKATASRVVALGEWPKRDAQAVRLAARNFLTEKGASAVELAPIFNPLPVKAGGSPTTTMTPTDPEEDTMLLRFEAVKPATRQAFKLTRSPFVDDVQTAADVFASPAIRYVREALLDCATHHGFIAVVGESGSGKSTLAEDLEQRIIDQGKPITVIRPYVLAMEDSESRGKPLRAPAIAEAIIRTLTPTAHCKSSPEARFAQIHETLRASSRAGQSHVLVIEEAHSLPVPTLKHLKRFLELKDGLRRLIGVALIGQPELRARLSEQAGEVREVVQRCELVELPPLDNDLEAYLRHKFQRVGAKVDDVFTADAYDAMRARLIRVPRGARPGEGVSVCHPLVVNNLCARAMNAAAAVGMAKVDAAVIAGC